MILFLMSFHIGFKKNYTLYFVGLQTAKYVNHKIKASCE
jgi:hypothetical protein